MLDDPSGQIKELLATPEGATLGPESRAGVLTETALDTKLDALLPATKLPSTRQKLIRALLLLWHDHLDAAHSIAQEIENADGAFVHAVMHRREPDAGNSKYWWRRVGAHPCFPELARQATALLESKNERELLRQIVPGGRWDAAGFVDACDSARRSAAPAARGRLLRELQRIEFGTLLDHLLANAGA